MGQVPQELKICILGNTLRINNYGEGKETVLGSWTEKLNHNAKVSAYPVGSSVAFWII